MMNAAEEGEKDCGGLVTIAYLSGEHITGFTEGRPLFARDPNSSFNLKNFLRSHLYSAISAMKAGVDILIEREGVTVDEIWGHGGFFKTEGVGQKIMAAALNTPVSVLETAGEGGAWGIALLASYMVNEENETLSDFLNSIFAEAIGKAEKPATEYIEGFARYYKRYWDALAVEKAAVECL